MHLSEKSPSGVGGYPPKYDFLTFNSDAPGEERGMQTEAAFCTRLFKHCHTLKRSLIKFPI